MDTSFVNFERTYCPYQGYCEDLRREKTELDIHTIKSAAACGNLLRLVNNVSWATMLLEFVSHEFLIKPIATLQVDEPRLARSISVFRRRWQNSGFSSSLITIFPTCWPMSPRPAEIHCPQFALLHPMSFLESIPAFPPVRAAEST